MADRLQDGIILFNSGRYFDAHEAWEDMWRELSGPDRLVCQGLIHAAVGLHHLYRENRRGAVAQIEKGLTKLKNYGAEYQGIDLECLRRDLCDAMNGKRYAKPGTMLINRKLG